MPHLRKRVKYGRMHGRNYNQQTIHAMKPVLTQHLASKPTLAGQGFLLTVALLMAGCTANPLLPAEPASGAAVAPDPVMATDASSADSALLATIEGMQNGERMAYDGRTLEAGNTYSAASGAQCRYVRFIENIAQTSTARLACHDGHHRFFATDVFASQSGAARQP